MKTITEKKEGILLFLIYSKLYKDFTKKQVMLHLDLLITLNDCTH